MLRCFTIIRNKDVSGVSGTGTVAEGVQFSDGTCIIRWLTGTATIAIYKSLKDLEKIHGHDGCTIVRFRGEE